jgi:hypothetical protein
MSTNQTPEELAAIKAKEEEAAAAKAAAEEAKKAAKEEAKRAAAAEVAAKAAENDPNRRVKIKLFKDDGKYKDDLFVSVNDYTAKIRRGEWVSVPLYVAKHIEEMAAQDESTAVLITRLTDEFANKDSKK